MDEGTVREREGETKQTTNAAAGRAFNCLHNECIVKQNCDYSPLIANVNIVTRISSENAQQWAEQSLNTCITVATGGNFIQLMKS